MMRAFIMRKRAATKPFANVKSINGIPVDISLQFLFRRKVGALLARSIKSTRNHSKYNGDGSLKNGR